MNKQQKRQRIIAGDVQWCIDNKNNLTSKSFAEHHNLLDKQYTKNRYQSIISGYLPQYETSLKEELNNWKRTSNFTQYWLEKKQIRAKLNTQESCLDYAENTLREQTEILTTNFQSTTLPRAVCTRPVIPESVESTPNNAIDKQDDVENSRSSPSPTNSAFSSGDINVRPVVPWMFNDSNVAEIFQSFQHKVNASSRENLFQIEKSIHDKQVLLRWTNITSDSSGKKRPDATITKLNQLAFGQSLGFGEAKTARSTPDKYNLCHDLLRLALFCKETIDKNKLNATLAFQIHGFSVVFYLMRLNHDGVYCLYEVCKLSFPRSLEELSSFLSLKNLNTLMRVSDMFWRMCKPVPSQDIITLTEKCRPTHSSLYNFIDSTKDRRRVCALSFDG